MIVDQIDAFKNWLTAVLKPMCEADPAALAKYVLALIKKDKSDDELRKSMIGQLEVFLEGETETFVNLVFETLTTKDYITTPVIPNTNPPNPNVALNVTKDTKDAPPVKVAKVIVQPSELPNLNDAVNGTKKPEPEVKKDVKLRRDSETEKEERPPRRRSRHRSLSRNRSRTRSRSWDRSKRSRSREKSRDREQYRADRDKRRNWRNKSPVRRYDRGRSRTPTYRGLRSRSRSPRHPHKGGAGGGRYRGPGRSSVSRSRSRSPVDKRTGDHKEMGHSRPGSPSGQSDSVHAGEDGRPAPPGAVASVVVQPNGGKRRCRDFDEKGYCMRGEMCPYDHGVDPVVLEDAALTRVLTYNPNAAATPATSDVVTTAGVIPGAAPILAATVPGAHSLMGHRHPGVPPDNPYNPQAPHIWRDGRFRGPRPMMARLPGMNPFAPANGPQRELIPVPVLGEKPPDVPPYAQYNHHHHHHHGGFIPGGDYKKKPFDYNRLGPRGGVKNPSNCSLELKKVPPGMNSITHLNNHFSRFGKIVNIQVQFEGDPEGALITFSSHAEANAAYRSTEAVLNNRFIKVFWHNQNPEGKQENLPPQQQKSQKLSTTAFNNSHTNKVLNLVNQKVENTTEASEENSEKQAKEKEENKAQATAAIKKNQDLLAAQAKVKKNQDEQRKEVLKIQNDLRKRKQELLDKQLSQQKILIEKMEKLPPGPQRDVIKETIKKTQEAIEGIKKDLEQAAQVIKAASQRKTKEEQQKELLDAELDLIAKQQEDEDTTELQKKLIELRAKVKTFSGPTRGRGRGRGVRYSPIASRHLLSKNNLVDNNKKANVKLVNKVTTPQPTSPFGASFQKHTVDHRPTRLLISGYEAEEQDSVLSHFQQFGEVADYIVDSSLPSITLNYKTRKEAEAALLKGKHFQDRTLSITWCNNRQLQTQMSSSSTRTVLLSESEEDHLIDQSLLEGDDEAGPEISEEALLQDDEEEEDEERSWRR